MNVCFHSSYQIKQRGCTKHQSNVYLERVSLKFTTRLYSQVVLLCLPKMRLIIKDWPKSSVSPLPPSFGLYLDRILMEKMGEGKGPIHEMTPTFI